MKNYYHTKSNNIFKKLRIEANLTQREVADILCVKQNTVSTWETGTAIPDQKLLPKIARLYKTSVDLLLTTVNQEDTDSDANLLHDFSRLSDESKAVIKNMIAQLLAAESDHTFMQYELARENALNAEDKVREKRYQNIREARELYEASLQEDDDDRSKK